MPRTNVRNPEAQTLHPDISHETHLPLDTSRSVQQRLLEPCEDSASLALSSASRTLSSASLSCALAACSNPSSCSTCGQHTRCQLCRHMSCSIESNSLTFLRSWGREKGNV